MAPPFVTKLYAHAPAPAQTLLAATRALQIKRRRYPANAEMLTEEALARDRFSIEQWDGWQADRLHLILDRAAYRVPYYRSLLAEHGLDANEMTNPGSLASWPLLQKDHVRADPAAFIADDRSTRSLAQVNTSGTSGTPVVVYRDKDDDARHYAIYEARVRRWNRVSREDPWVMMGGQLVAPFSRSKPPFWVHAKPLSQLYLSTHHLKPGFAAAYAEELMRFNPSHIVGYPSSMVLLARMALDQDLQLPTLTTLISNAEALAEDQRQILREAFGCEPRDTYGMSEGAAAAAECQAGSLHLSPDVGLVEVVGEDDLPVKPGTIGEIVVTGLVNETTILIRYRTGDRGALSASPCPCGLAAAVIEKLEGRISDLIRTPDGRQVFWLNPVFAGLPMREAQIIQPRLDRLDVRIVPAADWTTESADTLRQRLRDRVGEMSIEIDLVDEIQRGPNGKFQPVVSLL